MVNKQVENKEISEPDNHGPLHAALCHLDISGLLVADGRLATRYRNTKEQLPAVGDIL